MANIFIGGILGHTYSDRSFMSSRIFRCNMCNFPLQALIPNTGILSRLKHQSICRTESCYHKDTGLTISGIL